MSLLHFVAPQLGDPLLDFLLVLSNNPWSATWPRNGMPPQGRLLQGFPQAIIFILVLHLALLLQDPLPTLKHLSPSVMGIQSMLHTFPMVYILLPQVRKGFMMLCPLLFNIHYLE